jgi:hypothetical protein
MCLYASKSDRLAESQQWYFFMAGGAIRGFGNQSHKRLATHLY